MRFFFTLEFEICSHTPHSPPEYPAQKYIYQGRGPQPWHLLTPFWVPSKYFLKVGGQVGLFPARLQTSH